MEIEELYNYVEKFCSDDKLIMTHYAKAFILQIVDSGERGINSDNIYIDYLASSDLEYEIAKKVLQALLNKNIITFNGSTYRMFTAKDWGKNMESCLCRVLGNE